MEAPSLEMFLHASPEERLYLALEDRYAEVLLRHLGEEAYAELRQVAAVTQADVQSQHLAGKAAPNLVFVPGVMGSLLASQGLGGMWWVDALHLGRINDLGLSSDGIDDADEVYDVQSVAIHTTYTAFFAAVAREEDFKHHAFHYDWRKSPLLTASTLAAAISRLYEQNGGEPINVVAHSMGGLIVRAALMRHPELWHKLNRIVFIGTPHYGSPVIAGYLKNHLGGFDLMALLGRYLSRATFRSLWGVLSLLPSPAGVYPGTRHGQRGEEVQTVGGGEYLHPCANFDLYAADSWDLDLNSHEQEDLQRVLDGAASFHRQIHAAHLTLDQEFRDRMCVIAGVGYKSLFRLDYRSAFRTWEYTGKTTSRIPGDPHREGDGRVPLASSLLEWVGESRFIRGKHHELPTIPAVYRDALRWLRGEGMHLPASAQDALSHHLAADDEETETPHLAGVGCRGDTPDDPGFLNLDDPDPDRLAALQVRLEEGRLPEFFRLQIL